MIEILPQLIMLILFGASFGISLLRHGEERTQKENFFTSLIAALILQALLLWGGFYDPLFK